MLQIDSENNGLFIYPTEVLIASVKTNRLYLSVKSLNHSPKYSYLVIFLEVKKYRNGFQC